jgi:hypothetical protein
MFSSSFVGFPVYCIAGEVNTWKFEHKNYIQAGESQDVTPRFPWTNVVCRIEIKFEIWNIGPRNGRHFRFPFS